MAVETLRVPPPLGPDKARPGSLLEPIGFDAKAVPILDTYSPYPVFSATKQTHDPFGLNAFLMSPFDDVWMYMNPAGLPMDDEVKSEKEPRRLSANPFRRSSPLAVNPPVSAGGDNKADGTQWEVVEVASPEPEVGEVVGALPTSHSGRSLTGRGLRAFIGRKSTLSEGGHEESSRLSESRTDSVCSALSSISSSSEASLEGIQTPDGVPVPVDVSPASVAAALDDGKKPTGWRDWISNRRTSFLGLKSENGNTLLESPRASVIDLAPQMPETADDGFALSVDTRAASQLRRLSIAKLAAMRMPSPHPLALNLTRQNVNLPDEVAFSIPATKRVFPMSVNVIQKFTDLAPAQGGGLRLALAVRGVISKIDRGECPSEPLRARRSSRPNSIPRPRGVRDFVSRPPFEERTVTYFPDDTCSHVTMARRGYAIYDVEFSDYILALAETEEHPITWTNGSPKTRPTSVPPSKSSPIERKNTPADKRASVLIDKAKRESRIPARPATSFRTARPKPTTWDDSSDEEELGTDDEELKKPVRPEMPRVQTAPARTRESRVVDAETALRLINGARERRAEFNKGECERKAESNTRKSMILPTSKSTASLVKADRPISKRASTMTLAARPQVDTRPQATKRASSGTLSAATPDGAQSPPRQQRPPSSLPASPRHGPQKDRRRVVSQYDPMAAMASHHRQSMGMSIYGMPPPVPAYPVMVQPMMYAPVQAMPMHGAPMMGFNRQFPGGMPQMPHMYRPTPQMPMPAQPGRRRERPVS